MFVVFFFQAEDGIRDLVRSRGLGDVYKRQHPRWRLMRHFRSFGQLGIRATCDDHGSAGYACGAVSYTHLTLPTSDLV